MAFHIEQEETIGPWSEKFETKESHSRLARHRNEITFDLIMGFVLILLVALITVNMCDGI